MKKILILNILAAVLLAANARAEEKTAFSQLAGAAGVEDGAMIPEAPGYFTEMPLACGAGYTVVTIAGFSFCMPADGFSWEANPALPDSFEYGAEIAPSYLRAYVAQSAAKRTVAESLPGVSSPDAFIKSGKVRVTADAEAVYLVAEGKVLRLADARLAAKVSKLVARPGASAPQAANKIWFYYGAAVAIDCMTDDACWGAVGDAVSAVSEWANS